VKVVAGVAALLIVPVLLAGAVATFTTGATGLDGEQPSSEALADIPAELLGVYQRAADSCPGLPWPVLAGVGKVESDHARHGGATLDSHLNVRPAIIGVALDGTGGTAAIRDSDDGELDGDRTWDRAVGPLQFIPSTWRSYAADGDGDGIANPHNYADAAFVAAAYLCAHGADTGQLRAAVLAYNHASWYADQVLQWAHRYATIEAATSGRQLVGDYALPVARALLSPSLIDRPHHDYPAWDLAVAEGTRVHAVTAGVVLAVTADSGCGNGVVIHGSDGGRYTYCHGSSVTVTAGQRIAAGQPIMLSGNTGRSTGPHLHLQIHNPAGTPVCPQPLVLDLYQGQHPPPLSQLPQSGCSY